MKNSIICLMFRILNHRGDIWAWLGQPYLDLYRAVPVSTRRPRPNWSIGYGVSVLKKPGTTNHILLQRGNWFGFFSQLLWKNKPFFIILLQTIEFGHQYPVGKIWKYVILTDHVAVKKCIYIFMRTLNKSFPASLMLSWKGQLYLVVICLLYTRDIHT